MSDKRDGLISHKPLQVVAELRKKWITLSLLAALLFLSSAVLLSQWPGASTPLLGMIMTWLLFSLGFLALGSLLVFRPLIARVTEVFAAIGAREQKEELEMRLKRALEIAEDEESAIRVVEQALAGGLTNSPSEVLLAESASDIISHRISIGEVPDAAHCIVEKASDCPTVRRGQGMIYEDSMALSACPGLKGRINTNCAAVCAPVTISGHGAGMIRAIGESKADGLHPMLEMVQSVSFHLGMRLATLRSMASSERAASTDPLTGLANRRTMERQVEGLTRRGQLFSVVIVDIDHFKKLNDTHGHETGDKAIKAVASLLRRSIREQDLVCRFGGEEFVFILPGFGAEEAMGVYHRIQKDLPGALQRASLPLFTLSAGVADQSHGSDFESILCLADQALYQAKNAGRNRAVQAGLDAGVWPPI